MSKAFTRESDVEEAETDPAATLPHGQPNYITPAGLTRLQDELKHLRGVERPKVVETAAWAI